MPVFSSSKEISSIVIEKKNEITSPLGGTSARIFRENSGSMQDVADAKMAVTTKLNDLVTSGDSLQSSADVCKATRVPMTAISVFDYFSVIFYM